MWSTWEKEETAESWVEVLKASTFFTVYNKVASAMWNSEVDGFSKRGSKICFSEGFWHRLDEEEKDLIWLRLYCFLLSWRFSILNRHDQWTCVHVCMCVGHTGWAWQTLATSSQEAPYSMARAASLIISPAPWRRKDKCVEHVFFYMCEIVRLCYNVKKGNTSQSNSYLYHVRIVCWNSNLQLTNSSTCRANSPEAECAEIIFRKAYASASCRPRLHSTTC